MKKGLLISFMTLLSAAVVFTSCRKDDDKENNYRSAIDNATAENMFDDVFRQSTNAVVAAEDSAQMLRSVEELLSTCATLTITPFDLTTFPKTIIVDFGATNCLGDDGRYRRGSVEMSITGWYRDSGTVITVTPNNYYVNNNRVQGTKTLTNNGHNTAGNLNYTIQVNGTVTTSNGTIAWTSTRNHEWIEGESTVLNPWDDVYLVTGSASGTNIEGEDFEVVINTALRVQVGCRWITAGVLTLTSGDFEMSVNYGSGNCDAAAVVTLNGNDYDITMQ